MLCNLWMSNLQANFLEVSSISFVKDLGVKGKEAFVKKRTGSTQPGRAGCNCCGLLDTLVCVRYELTLTFHQCSLR